VNRIACYIKVLNVPYCCICIWQLRCICYFNIALCLCVYMAANGVKVKCSEVQNMVVPWVVVC
jgi:hypothetical protein